MRSIILCGPNGSGKTTVGKIIAARANLRAVSTGAFFRAEADQRFPELPTVTERCIKLGLLYEEHPELDKALDDKVLATAAEGAVIDGRASAWLAHLRGIDAYKVWFDVNPLIGARRVSLRDGVPVTEAVEKNIVRERDIARRLGALYGLDLRDRSYFDLILRTDDLEPENVADIIMFAAAR